MSAQMRLQDPGEGLHEARIIEVHVAQGQHVREGDDLFTIETDKAAVVIPSPFDGTVDTLVAHKGDAVTVGEVLLTYTAGDSGATQTVPGKPAAPATRRLARELGVDLQMLEGNGRGGRIEPGDVLLAAKRAATTAHRACNSASTAGEPPAHEQQTAPGLDFARWGEVEVVEESPTRRTIAQKMALAWRTIPHATHADYVDVSKLEALRIKHADRVCAQGGKLTLTVFALKAIALTVRDFPRFNASLDAASGKLVLKRYCNIGVAVDTTQGLLVPVLRAVADKSLSQLAVELVEVTQRARDGELHPADMHGGSITLTNPGSLGAAYFTPIINYPEVAIVGLGTARTMAFGAPAQHAGTDPRPLWLPLIIGFDHRVNDGADAARFARRIGELLAAPAEMLLGE